MTEPKSAKPTINATADVTVKARLAKSLSGSTASGARSSTNANTTMATIDVPMSARLTGDDHAYAVGAVLAAHASIALSAALEREHAEQMADALRTSREIGMAMGVLMGRSGATEDEAFAMLRRASQHLHRKLRQVAAEVIETGQLPQALPSHRK